MNGHEINKAAQFAAPGSGHHLVRRKVNRMQDVTEHLILDWEKAIVAVHDSFQARAGVIFGHGSGVNRRQLPEPRHTIGRRFKNGCRRFPGRGEPPASGERRFEF